MSNKLPGFFRFFFLMVLVSTGMGPGFLDLVIFFGNPEDFFLLIEASLTDSSLSRVQCLKTLHGFWSSTG